MLWYENWIMGSHKKSTQLSYLVKVGFLFENKNTAVADIPFKKKLKEYTPKGYVDLDLEWFSTDLIRKTILNQGQHIL